MQICFQTGRMHQTSLPLYASARNAQPPTIRPKLGKSSGRVPKSEPTSANGHELVFVAKCTLPRSVTDIVAILDTKLATTTEPIAAIHAVATAINGRWLSTKLRISRQKTVQIRSEMHLIKTGQVHL